MTDEGPAELLFEGGDVFTSTADEPIRADVAVRGGVIAAVGPPDDVAGLVGPATRRVDLAGRLLTAGFTDAHVHPVAGGARLSECDLESGNSVAEYLAAVRAYADAHPTREWIVGGGWAMGDFPGGAPTRQLLDDVVADRPVTLMNRDGHGTWVNSRALELAGITATTSDPVDGRIERDAAGEATGMMHEGAMVLVNRLLPAPTDDDLYRGLLAGQDYLLSHGITSWQDAIVGDSYNLADVLPAYLRAVADGSLKASVVGALWWDRDRGAEQIPELLERRAAAGSGRFSASTIKIMQDGIAENFTAAMTQPYLDACGCTTANAGLSFVDPELLRTIAVELDGHGFQLHFHALGDRAVREALDALASARAANGPNDHRHHLAHLQVVHPDDIARFAALGATANIQPLWATHETQMDELTLPFLGGELGSWQYPFADLAHAGARLAGGSDWPVTTANVWSGIHTAVNRRTAMAPGADDPRPPFIERQALPLSSVLTAYTAGGAFVNHRDDRSGTIAAGRDADLAVHDRNPFETPADRIADTRVDQTYIGGELVFDAGR